MGILSFGDQPEGSCLALTQKKAVVLHDSHFKPFYWRKVVNYIKTRKSRDILCVTDIKNWQDFVKIHAVETLHRDEQMLRKNLF